MPAGYVTLSSVYFFYFAILGAVHPYWGLYLQSLGYDAAQIGTLMAVFIATKLIAPNIWSYWADRRGAHLSVMRLGALLTPLCFAGVYLQQGFISLLLVMVLFSFFWNAILPQYELITLKAMRGHEERYGQIRLWGSVGFIAAVVVLGSLLDRVAVQWLPLAVLLIMVLMVLSSWCVRLPVQMSGHQSTHPGMKALWQTLRHPAVIAFLLAVMLMQLSHGPYYTFFSIYMEQVGHSRSLIGLLWSLGVIAEVGLFAIMHRLLQRFQAGHLLLVSLLLAAVRWWLTAFFAQSLGMLVLIQLLHAATFALFHSACIALVHRFFSDNLAAQGQAVYSSVGFGVGGALGAWISGWLWQQSSAETSFLLASLAALLAVFCVAVSLVRQRDYWLAKYDCKV